ncbi:helix-turn-helix transcriptional regulator [Methanosarcina sp. KYL-1]|uniref:helix-turn-helix domain-containing protein n=1 Tax=Methanosarcina sp. KYL-1 TaxID=2602068 RepID=UPI0021016537|nr:helix-turn-helix transcriptional regulator [Methanosarcina sp. KYL-1]MCQ1534835.1 helix-turn-helix transcriptional regulator [Methanosarcina sp. KYL-1]
MEDGISRKFNYFGYFVNQAKIAQQMEDSTLYAFIGRRRSGKSVISLAMACRIDPDITAENICFGAKQLTDALKSMEKTSIVWEEATAAGGYNRDWHSPGNAIVNKTLQVYGEKRIAIVANLQHLKILDPQVQVQTDCIFRCWAEHEKLDEGEYRKNTFFEPWRVNTDFLTEPVLMRYTINRDGVYSPIGMIPVPQMDDLFKICGVSKSLYTEYRKKKAEFFESIGEDEEAEKIDKKKIGRLQRMAAGCVKLIRDLNANGMTQGEIAGKIGVNHRTISEWKNYDLAELSAIQ